MDCEITFKLHNNTVLYNTRCFCQIERSYNFRNETNFNNETFFIEDRSETYFTIKLFGDHPIADLLESTGFIINNLEYKAYVLAYDTDPAMICFTLRFTSFRPPQAVVKIFKEAESNWLVDGF